MLLVSSISIIVSWISDFSLFLYNAISAFWFQLVLVAYIWNYIVYSIADPFCVNKYSFHSAIAFSSKSPNIYIIQFLKLSQLKKIYFISRLVVVALFIWYSIKYSLNYFNAFPVKNIPAYTTASASITILGPSYLSFNNICVRYPLSLIRVPSNHLTAGNLTVLVPILFSLLLKASWP